MAVSLYGQACRSDAVPAPRRIYDTLAENLSIGALKRGPSRLGPGGLCPRNLESWKGTALQLHLLQQGTRGHMLRQTWNPSIHFPRVAGLTVQKSGTQYGCYRINQRAAWGIGYI